MPELVKFPETAHNIPAMLRLLADEIDAGEHSDLTFIVAVMVTLKEGAITTETRGWGKCSPLEAVGALTWASDMLTKG